LLKMQNPHEMQSLISPCFPAWCPGGRTQQNAARDCAAPPRRVTRRRGISGALCGRRPVTGGPASGLINLARRDGVDRVAHGANRAQCSTERARGEEGVASLLALPARTRLRTALHGAPGTPGTRIFERILAPRRADLLPVGLRPEPPPRLGLGRKRRLHARRERDRALRAFHLTREVAHKLDVALGVDPFELRTKSTKRDTAPRVRRCARGPQPRPEPRVRSAARGTLLCPAPGGHTRLNRAEALPGRASRPESPADQGGGERRSGQRPGDDVASSGAGHGAQPNMLGDAERAGARQGPRTSQKSISHSSNLSVPREERSFFRISSQRFGDSWSGGARGAFTQPDRARARAGETRLAHRR